MTDYSRGVLRDPDLIWIEHGVCFLKGHNVISMCEAEVVVTLKITLTLHCIKLKYFSKQSICIEVGAQEMATCQIIDYKGSCFFFYHIKEYFCKYNEILICLFPPLIA